MKSLAKVAAAMLLVAFVVLVAAVVFGGGRAEAKLFAVEIDTRSHVDKAFGLKLVDNGPCNPFAPNPPLELELPDGTIIPIARVSYDFGARRVIAIGYDRLFCDGFDGIVP